MTSPPALLGGRPAGRRRSALCARRRDRRRWRSRAPRTCGPLMSIKGWGATLRQSGGTSSGPPGQGRSRGPLRQGVKCWSSQPACAGPNKVLIIRDVGLDTRRDSRVGTESRLRRSGSEAQGVQVNPLHPLYRFLPASNSANARSRLRLGTAAIPEAPRRRSAVTTAVTRYNVRRKRSYVY